MVDICKPVWVKDTVYKGYKKCTQGCYPIACRQPL